VDKAYAGKSRDAADHPWRAAVETGDTSVAGHASCATTEAGATEHSAGAFAKSTAAEADANAAFYPADETGSGG
jgi:hypothetical protein